MSAELEGNAPQSIDEIWEKTILRFLQRTGKKLDGAPKSLDSLQKSLETSFGPKNEDENVSRAKANGLKIIHCIQLLGGIAAKGASMVFGPAECCFNALSFLLDIPKKVHEAHGEINDVFAEVGPALAHFRIYQRIDEHTEIDRALRMSIYQVMMSFVDLCASCLATSQGGGWESFKNTTKRVFLDDTSVKDELTKFKNLTQAQLNIQATLTLETALETNQYASFITARTISIDENTKVIRTEMVGLAEGERKRTLEDTRKQNLSSVKSKIGLRDEQIATMIDSRDKMWKSSVPDSGKWLNDVAEYKQWFDRDSSADHLLVLKGDPGTGKSFLVSAIAQDIKSGNSATKAERNLVGHYSFSIAEKGEGDSKRPETAIKSICVQLVEQSHVYAKHVAGECAKSGKDEKYFRDASCKKLWKTLGIGVPAKKTTHYILLDAVSVLKGAELDRLVEAVSSVAEEGKSNRVRILLSVEPATVMQRKLSSALKQCVDITEHNDVDIRKFITQELEKADLFQGKDEDSQRRKAMAEECLMKRSNNCYLTVQQDLRKIKEIIASSGTEGDLNRVLQESNTDPRDLIRSDIETLEAVLKHREIEEISELLIWVVAGSEFFELDELEAALFLRFNTVSLQPLSQKIDGKYSKIFHFGYGDSFLTLKEYVYEHVIAKRDRPRESADDPKINVTINITNGNVKAVQRFFWDLNHYTSFLDGFVFQQASDLSSGGNRRIQLYEVDAHFEIAKRAFKFFFEPPADKRGRHIGEYLMTYITDHLDRLHEATGLDELQLADKQYVGSNVYDMFNEGDWIEEVWDFCSRAKWYKREKKMRIFWKWLDDPVAVARLGPRDKRWLAEMTNDQGRNLSLLTPIMTVIARNWLRETKWDAPETYKWLSGFLALGANPTSSDDESGEETDSSLESSSERGDDDKESQTEDGSDTEEDFDTDENESEFDEEDADIEEDGEIFIKSSDSILCQVIKVERWCKQALKVEHGQIDHIWYIRLGQTCVHLGRKRAAVKRFKLAAAYLEAQDPVNKEELRDVYQALGRASVDRDTALEFYKQAYEQDELNVGTLSSLLTLNVLVGRDDEVKAIMPKAIIEKVPNTEFPLLVSILKKAVDFEEEEHLWAMFEAVHILISPSPENWTSLRQGLEAAIENERTEKNNENLATFLFLLGAAIHYFRKEYLEDLNTAVEHWCECLLIIREKLASEDQEKHIFVRDVAIRHLSMLYFDRAIHAEGAELEEHAGKLQDIYEDNNLSPSIQHLLASFYTFHGQDDKARDLLRSRMITAFNILSDDDTGNDYHGFLALHKLLSHTGDYVNAHNACMMMVPEWKFDKEVLKTLLAEDEPSLEAASLQLAEFYDREYPEDTENLLRMDVCKIMEEAERLSAAAEPDTDEAAAYRRICAILNDYDSVTNVCFACDNCNRYWNYETGFHHCKYCYNIILCDDCWNTLRSDHIGTVLVCSKSHQWFELEPWTIDSYVRAWKRLIPVKGKDGEETLISVSKWLGNLCEDWGLSKSDWNFE